MSPPASAAESALRDSLASLGLPHGLLAPVLRNYDRCDSRLWVLDNSARMKVRRRPVRPVGRDVRRPPSARPPGGRPVRSHRDPLLRISCSRPSASPSAPRPAAGAGQPRGPRWRGRR